MWMCPSLKSFVLPISKVGRFSFSIIFFWKGEMNLWRRKLNSLQDRLSSMFTIGAVPKGKFSDDAHPSLATFLFFSSAASYI